MTCACMHEGSPCSATELMSPQVCVGYPSLKLHPTVLPIQLASQTTWSWVSSSHTFIPHLSSLCACAGPGIANRTISIAKRTLALNTQAVKQLLTQSWSTCWESSFLQPSWYHYKLRRCATPGSNWYKHAEKLVKGVGDIWSDCSECSKFIRMLLGVFFFLIVVICTVVLNCNSSAVKPVAK